MSEKAGGHLASTLPSGWCVMELAEAGEVVTGNTPPTSEKDNFGDEYPLVRPTELGTDRPIVEAAVGLSKKGASLARLLPVGSVLVSCIGSLGKVGIAGCELATNQQINSVVFDPELVDARYGFYYCQTITKWLEEHSSATTISIINKSKFQKAPFVLAPLRAQKLIVGEIEKQFTRLDAATAALRRVQANLNRYRTSVLKAACEGRLVPAEAELARKEGRDYEPAGKLLQRILLERRARWEADTLSKMKASGRLPKDNGWKQKYKEPSFPDTSDLPSLPEGWCWASIDQLTAEAPYALAIGPFGSNLKVSDYKDHGVPLVFVRNIRSRIFDGDGDFFVSPEKARELTPHGVSSGDVLVTKMGDPPGDACVYPANLPDAVITADCIKIRFHQYLPFPDLFVSFIESPLVKKQVLQRTRGVAQLKVSLERIRDLALPLAPVDEQRRLSFAIQSQSSRMDALNEDIQREFSRVDSFRQSLLRSAFTGQLVPQDLTDEPAFVLLQRIRADRASALSRKSETRSTRRSASYSASGVHE